MNDLVQPSIPTVTLTITYREDGQINVGGPINNKGLCYQILELAKDVIRDHVAKYQQPGIVIPPPGTRIPDKVS